MSKPKTVCVDFDGVLHSYESGWKGADVVADGPVPGAMEWLTRLVDAEFHVCVYSARSSEPGGIRAMRQWLAMELPGGFDEVYTTIDKISFPIHKPAAHITIDSSAYCFRGRFPEPGEIEKFQPWWKHG